MNPHEKRIINKMKEIDPTFLDEHHFFSPENDSKHHFSEEESTSFIEKLENDSKHHFSTRLGVSKHHFSKKMTFCIYILLHLFVCKKSYYREERDIKYKMFFAIQNLKNFFLTYPGKNIFSDEMVSLLEKMDEEKFKTISDFFEEMMSPAFKEMKEPVPEETPFSPSEEKGKTIPRKTPISPSEEKEGKIDFERTQPFSKKKAGKVNLEQIKKRVEKLPSSDPKEKILFQPIPWIKRELSDRNKDLTPAESCHVRYRNKTPLERDFAFYKEMIEETNKERAVEWKAASAQQFVEGRTRTKAAKKKAIQVRKQAHEGRLRADKQQIRYTDYAWGILMAMEKDDSLKNLDHQNYLQPSIWGGKPIFNFWQKYFSSIKTQWKFNREDIKHGDLDLLPENFKLDYDPEDEMESDMFYKQQLFYKEILLECNRLVNAGHARSFQELVVEAIERRMLPLSYVQRLDLHKDERLKGFTMPSR